MYYDVLLHVDTDATRFTMALRNAKNYSDAITNEEYTIAIVVNGKAIELLRRDTCPHPELISTLCSGRVRIYGCHNAMREHNITPDDLVPEVTIVPAGLVHVVKLQREGFAYIKP